MKRKIPLCLHKVLDGMTSRFTLESMETCRKKNDTWEVQENSCHLPGALRFVPPRSTRELGRLNTQEPLLKGGITCFPTGKVGVAPVKDVMTFWLLPDSVYSRLFPPYIVIFSSSKLSHSETTQDSQSFS